MLKGEKVVLREKRLEDAAADYAWKKDAEIAYLDATFPTEVPFSRYLIEYREELSHLDSQRRRFAIETLDGKHVGNCSFYDINEYSKEAELGIIIGDKDYWGKGYGSDAIAVLLNYIFTELKLERVYLHTLENNAPAQRCFQKCGFITCGAVRRGWHTFLMMEIGRDDWQERSGKKPVAQEHKLPRRESLSQDTCAS